MSRLTLSLPVFVVGLLISGCVSTPHKPDPLSAARRILHEAEGRNSAALYLEAARDSLSIATNDSASAATREQATLVYNRAVAECAVKLFETKPSARSRIQDAAACYQITFVPPAKVDRLLVSTTIPRKHLKEDVRRPGLGGTLVGVMDGPATAGPNRPASGYTEPLTAVAEFGQPSKGCIPVTIRLYDPRETDHITMAGSEKPLAGDFSAPLAYYPHVNEIIFGALSMLRSDLSLSRRGLLFAEPYDSKKIPVIFVHGLMSSPHAWLQVANELNADPEFRKRYQVWWYFYPTGSPIAANALGFREALADAAKRYRLRDNIVVVGHSMGGILSRMQVTNSGRAIWDAVFQSKADTLYERIPDTSIVKKALIFHANPHIARVIFIATPHRGSRLATLRISNLAASLIRMPKSLANVFTNELADTFRSIDPSVRSMPTSIRGLSPDNSLLLAVDKLKVTVPCNSIIGNRGRDDVPLEKSADGVVPYWSSHLDQAESELIVPTGHDAFNNPKSIAELERIFAK